MRMLKIFSMERSVRRSFPVALSTLALCAFLLHLTAVAGTGNYLLNSCPTPAEIVSLCSVHVCVRTRGVPRARVLDSVNRFNVGSSVLNYSMTF